MIDNRYESAKEIYGKLGTDTDKALELLDKISLSMNCWQGDDIKGFEKANENTTGGIQATGNYPGRARNQEELMSDLRLAYSLIPGKHRLNLHASYGDFEDNIDRNNIKPEQFDAWIEFAKKNDIKIDFNGTFFSHPLSENGTLSNVDDETRIFWVDHGIACLEISEYIGKALNDQVLYNIWIPDGMKEEPADRIGPRKRLKESLDRIIHHEYDKNHVSISVEQKVFGIGVESYTVGSHEFYLNYAKQNDILCLIDSGHFHPNENVADKLSSMSLFFEKVPMHITRNIHWDSDHVVRLKDNILDISSEIIKLGPEKFLIGVDFFDASINRIAAWVVGMRNVQKSLLISLLTPNDKLKGFQDKLDYTSMLVYSEEAKSLPFGDVWNYYCKTKSVPMDGEWYASVRDYEDKVLLKRG